MSSDQELLHVYVRQQDDAAFAELFTRHAPLILATCRRITGDPHEAEDATQAVFLVLARKAARLDASRPLGPWLHRVACFIALRQVAERRRRRREVRMSGLDEAAVAAVAPGSVVAEAADASAAASLDAALASLPARYREPIVLHYLEGRSCQEISRQMGIPEDLVATRLSRGRTRLKRRLRPSLAIHLTEALAALALPLPATARRPWPTSPTAPACALAHRYLRALWLVPASCASAAAVLCLAVAIAWGPARAPAADAPTPPALHQPRLSVAYPPREQEQLLVSLERTVSVAVRDEPALALIDSIGRQCGLTMVVDLPPERTILPPVRIALAHVPLQQVLDQIASVCDLRYDCYAGSLLWRERTPDLPIWDEVLPGIHPFAPTMLRLYRLRDLPPGATVQDVIADIQTHVPVAWTQAGVSIEELSTALVIGVSPADHLAIERYLATRWHQVPAAAAAAPLHVAASSPRIEDEAAMAATHRLTPLLERPLGRELRARDVHGALQEIATAAGIVITCAADAGDPPLRQRPIPALLSHLSVRDAIALVLDGTGLHGAIVAGASHAAAATLRIGRHQPPCLVTVEYRLPAPLAAPGVVTTAPEEYIECLRKNVDPTQWDDAAGVQCEFNGSTIIIRQSLEMQLALEEELPRLQAIFGAQALPPALTAPPPLILSPPPPGVRDDPAQSPQEFTSMPRQRL